MNFVNHKFLVFHLLIIEEAKVRKRIILDKEQYSLGRNYHNNIIIKSQQISRKHATFLKKVKSQTNEYSYWIFDGDLEGNKSNNGIYVNGEKCLIHELKDGDLINFGCEVNASYHVLSNSEKNTDFANILQSPSEKMQERNGKSTAPNFDSEPTNILFISEPHLAVNTTEQILNSKEDTLPDRAYLDPLTQLPNRSLFLEYLSIALGNAQQNQKPMAILYFDIEQLREINAQFGDFIGDQVLQEFGKQLKSCLRSGDIVARWGGDEFTILLPQINAVEDTVKICQRILNQMTKPIKIKDKEMEISSSVGFSIYPQDGTEESILLQKAEANLEKNKQQLKNKNPFTKTISSQKPQLLKIEKLLQKALSNQEFYLEYQPQINLKTNAIEGLEALLCWHHPQFGMIAPHQFIPWIEKIDLVIPLTQWVIETLCQQHQVWRKLGYTFLPISIDLSSYQLQHPDLLKILTQSLSNTGLDPKLLIVEITEKTLVENPEDAFRVLHELKHIGVKGAIDDFGSGAMSVKHLQQFPFSQIKIAQSLIQDLKKYPEEILMIAAVIALGSTFKLKVIAEGVETENQLDILQMLDCEIIQGYLFSQPLKAKDATEFLSSYT